jgi:hypothetical protein
MGSGRTRSTTPDLFSMASARESSPSLRSPAGSPPGTDATPGDFLPRHVLPKDLPSAIKQLQDRELDLLLAAVLAEQERRGRKPAVSAETSPKRRAKAVAVSLPHAKINAVRAAFKGGVTPSRDTLGFPSRMSAKRWQNDPSRGGQRRRGSRPSNGQSSRRSSGSSYKARDAFDATVPCQKSGG